MSPIGSVAAASGWRAVFETDQKKIVALPVVFWNLYDSGATTSAVVLAPTRTGFVEVMERKELLEEKAESSLLKGWVLKGYAAPGETLVFWERQVKERA
jgi:hypothetical protein